MARSRLWRKPPRVSTPMSSKLVSYIRIDPNPEQRWIQPDVLALGEPRPPAEKYRKIASNLIQKSIELGLGRGPAGPFGDIGAQYAGKTDLTSRLMLMNIDLMSSWGAGPMYQYWQTHIFLGDTRERFNWTIACILECGISWMLATARKCGFPYVDDLETKLSAYFRKDHFEGIKNMKWTETQTGRDAVTAIFRTANWAFIWSATGSPSEFFGETRPMLFSHGHNGNAMVFLPANALSQVVVPYPLLGDEYARFYRVWLLQAKDDPIYDKMMRGEKTKWVLWDKAILFTDVRARNTIVTMGSAGDGMPGWRLRQGVKVHGPS